MEGKYFIKEKNEEYTKHDHIIFNLGDINLIYNDTRKFGKMKLINKDEINNYFIKLGKEPKDLDLSYLKEKLNKSNTHKATIMAKDSEGRKSFSYLTIVSSSEDIEEPAPVIAPTIKWRGGNEGSFDEVHTIDPVNGLSVVIDITSETGITGFTLEIISETLTPEELAAINLSSKMDLINPGVHEGGLQFLEFPTGDQVKGQKEMSIDISSFMPMLAAIGAGTSNFVLNVTDDNGTTSKAIQLNVE